MINLCSLGQLLVQFLLIGHAHRHRGVVHTVVASLHRSLRVLSIVVAVALTFVLRRWIRLLEALSVHRRGEAWVPTVEIFTVFLILLCFLVASLALVLRIFSSVRGPSMAGYAYKIIAIVATKASHQRILRDLLCKSTLTGVVITFLCTQIRNFFL